MIMVSICIKGPMGISSFGIFDMYKNITHEYSQHSEAICNVYLEAHNACESKKGKM